LYPAYSAIGHGTLLIRPGDAADANALVFTLPSNTMFRGLTTGVAAHSAGPTQYWLEGELPLVAHTVDPEVASGSNWYVTYSGGGFAFRTADAVRVNAFNFSGSSWGYATPGSPAEGSSSATFVTYQLVDGWDPPFESSGGGEFPAEALLYLQQIASATTGTEIWTHDLLEEAQQIFIVNSEMKLILADQLAYLGTIYEGMGLMYELMQREELAWTEFRAGADEAPIGYVPDPTITPSQFAPEDLPQFDPAVLESSVRAPVEAQGFAVPAFLTEGSVGSDEPSMSIELPIGSTSAGLGSEFGGDYSIPFLTADSPYAIFRGWIHAIFIAMAGWWSIGRVFDEFRRY
jgi:hypothetical protein